MTHQDRCNEIKINFSNIKLIIMQSNNDYSNMTLEELVSEEKKMNSGKITTALLIGFIVGVAVWSATHKGIVLPIILLIFAYQIGNKNAQTLKDIQAEISSRNTVH
jgi:uncharacterized membrane protein YbjE (DUF340 family)